MNAILRSTTVAALLAVSVMSAGCSVMQPKRVVAVDDTQAYVDGALTPTIASIDQSLQTLVILARGDEGPRRSGAIGDTVAGGTPRRAPATVGISSVGMSSGTTLPSSHASSHASSYASSPRTPQKELARIERADEASSGDSSCGATHGDVKLTCGGAVPSRPSNMEEASRRSHSASSAANANADGVAANLATDPKRPPASPAAPEDGGADASRVDSAAQAARESLQTRVRLHWEGPVDRFIGQMAKAIGFKVQTEGRLGGLMVAVHEEDATVERVLREAAAQIDGKADIRVDTHRRTIWLVATRR